MTIYFWLACQDLRLTIRKFGRLKKCAIIDGVITIHVRFNYSWLNFLTFCSQVILYQNGTKDER